VVEYDWQVASRGRDGLGRQTLLAGNCDNYLCANSAVDASLIDLQVRVAGSLAPLLGRD
jgi:hypothetical protein